MNLSTNPKATPGESEWILTTAPLSPKQLASTFQIDHTIPLHLGGSNDDCNLQALCVGCHAVKTQKEAVARADMVWKKQENLRRQKKIDEREDRVIQRFVKGQGMTKMLQCETCKQYRSVTEGWETHRCEKLEPPTETLTIFTFTPRTGLGRPHDKRNVEVSGY